MRATITTADVLAVLKKMAPAMVGHKDDLCQLDAAMGDGDQGHHHGHRVPGHCVCD